MPAPHPGQWDIVYDGENPLDTQQTAVHACMIYNSTLGEPALINRGKVVVSGGFRYNYDPSIPQYTLVFNNDMEIYDPAVPVWSYLGVTANNPFIANYPGTHVIPYGSYAGQLLYSIPKLENGKSYIFVHMTLHLLLSWLKQKFGILKQLRILLLHRQFPTGLPGIHRQTRRVLLLI